MLSALSRRIETAHWNNESTDPLCIHKAGMAGNTITIWHRKPATELSEAVIRLPHSVIPDRRINASLTGFRQWLDDLIQQTPAAHRGDFQLLAADMLKLANWFDLRWKASEYTFRMHPLSDTMCPRFHTDHGAMRLLCTYRGPGTEWVEESGVNRKAMRTIGTDNQCIVPNAQAIKHIPNYAAALLCGCDDNGEGGVVHRSPEVAEGENRITFCMTLTD